MRIVAPRQPARGSRIRAVSSLDPHDLAAFVLDGDVTPETAAGESGRRGRPDVHDVPRPGANSCRGNDDDGAEQGDAGDAADRMARSRRCEAVAGEQSTREEHPDIEVEIPDGPERRHAEDEERQAQPWFGTPSEPQPPPGEHVDEGE